MSSTSRSSFLYTLSERKVLLLAIPTLLVLAALLAIGRQSEKAPATVTAPDVAQAVSSTTPAGSGQIDANQKQAIEQIIKDYLVKNPEILVEVQGALEAKLEKEHADRLKVAIGVLQSHARPARSGAAKREQQSSHERIGEAAASVAYRRSKL